MPVQFKLTRDYLDKLREAISLNEVRFVQKQLDELYPADIAEVINELDLQQAQYIYKHLEEEIAADVLLELEEEIRERLLSSFTSKQIAEQIDNMASDDAADVIAVLPDKVQEEVLSHIEDSEQARDIADLLNYDENSAGGLMAKELIRVELDKNVLECVREMRQQAENVESVHTIYVVDVNEKLLGTLSLKRLLMTSLKTKIADVYNSEVISVRLDTPSDEVAEIMEKYNLVAIPVVDGLGRLVGRITIDDIVDVIREEETEDVQRMGGVQALEDPYMTLSFLQMMKKRAGWLVVLFIGESFTATAMSFFESEITKVVVLALFVPLIISSGGNAGSQASTLIIRALALGEITVRQWWDIFKREIWIGLALGVILGIIGFLRVAVWSAFVNIYGPHWMQIATTVGISLLGVVLWGNLVGSLLPMLLKRLGLDPAVSSTPFIATMVDVTGLLIYFSAASILLREILI